MKNRFWTMEFDHKIFDQVKDFVSDEIESAGIEILDSFIEKSFFYSERDDESIILGFDSFSHIFQHVEEKEPKRWQKSIDLLEAVEEFASSTILEDHDHKDVEYLSSLINRFEKITDTLKKHRRKAENEKNN
jgi:hypothetical protein